MMVKYNAKDLLKYVSKAASVVNSSALIPILKNILFKEKDGALCLYASDLKTSIEVKTEIAWDFDPLAIDTRKLVDLLKSLGSQEFEFKPATNGTSVEFKVRSGKYKISSYPGNEFPNLEFVKGENSIKGFMIDKAIELTQGCVSNDDLRPTMTGVYFDSELGNVVATNGHKLTRLKFNIKESFIVPPQTMSLLKGTGDAEVYYTISDNYVHFVTAGFSFKIVLVEGNYPPYDRVIPTGNEKKFEVDQVHLYNALKRVSLFSSSETNAITLNLATEGMQISGQDVNYGNQAEEWLEGKYVGEDLSIGLNAKYMLDLISASGEGLLTLTFSEPNKPVLMYNNSNENLLQLAMPIMI